MIKIEKKVFFIDFCLQINQNFPPLYQHLVTPSLYKVNKEKKICCCLPETFTMVQENFYFFKYLLFNVLNKFFLTLFINLYNKTTHSYIYIYMLRIAGQTAGPIKLKFFVDTHKNSNFFFNFSFELIIHGAKIWQFFQTIKLFSINLDCNFELSWETDILISIN